jgi:hypothetical protein
MVVAAPDFELDAALAHARETLHHLLLLGDRAAGRLS